MSARTFGILCLCAVVAACGSKSADEAAPTEASTVAAAPAPTMGSPVAMEPAPKGLPSRIAREVITASGQTCGQVANAERASDGTINATCSGGESYQVYTSPGQGPVAVKR